MFVPSISHLHHDYDTIPKGERGGGISHPEKDIGIQKIKKTSFGLEVSVI
jgi:hypothetical protein